MHGLSLLAFGKGGEDLDQGIIGGLREICIATLVYIRQTKRQRLQFDLGKGLRGNAGSSTIV